MAANSDSNTASDASIPHLPPYIGTDSNDSGGSTSDSRSWRGLKKDKLFQDLRKIKKSIGHLTAGEGPGTDAGTKMKKSS